MTTTSYASCAQPSAAVLPAESRSRAGPPGRAPERLWDGAKVAIALAALALTAVGTWLNRAPLLVFVDNSDFLYMAALYRDLVGHAYPARGWWVTPAPYFVPDVPLFFCATALTRSMAAAFCLYAGLTLACILGAFYWIGGLVSRSRADRLLVVSLTGLLFFVLARPADGSYWFAVKWLLVPTAHGGAVLMGLLLLGLGARLMLAPGGDSATESRSPRRARALASGGYAAFALVAFAAILSDRSVLYLFIAPTLAAGMLLTLFRRVRWWRPTLLAALAAAAMAGAGGFVGLARKNGWFTVPDFLSEHLPSRDFARLSWQQFRDDVGRMAVLRPTSPLMLLLAASLLAPAALAVVRLWRRARARRRGRGPARAAAQRAADGALPGPQPGPQPGLLPGTLALLALVGPPSYVLGLAVPIVMGLWAGPECLRYALSAVVLPLLVLGAFALRALRRMPGRWATGAAGAMLAAGAVAWLPVCSAVPPMRAALVTAPDGRQVRDPDPFYTPEVAFVDDVVRRHHLHNGFGNYWMTKPITLFSRAGTTVLTLDDSVEPPAPDFWISNPHWWAQRAGRPKSAGPLTAGDYPLYDFVLCPAMNRQWVEAHFGAPAAVESGPGGQVLIYDRPSDVMFRNAGRLEAEREVGVGPESRVVEPGRLNRPKPPGSPWNAPGAVRIPAGKSLPVRLARPIQGDFLCLQADSNDTYGLEFLLAGRTVGTAEAGPMPGEGLVFRDVNLVPATAGRAFDTVVIRPSGGDGVYSVGCLVVFTDPVLHPPARR